LELRVLFLSVLFWLCFLYFIRRDDENENKGYGKKLKLSLWE